MEPNTNIMNKLAVNEKKKTHNKKEKHQSP
jgi:hypothetical protein